MSGKYRRTWNLESVFEGGSSSPTLAAHMETLDETTGKLHEKVTNLSQPSAPEAKDQWHEALNAAQANLERLEEAGAFLYCSMAQDVNDTQAKVMFGRLQQSSADMESVSIKWQERILAMDEDQWQQLLADERFKPLAFPLQEMRDKAREQMDPARETLATDLAVDGYHAWSQLYDTVVGQITIPFEEDGQVTELSVGQARNKFSSPDAGVRARLFANWEESWAKESELCASALNHLAGFRLALYRHRGWDSVLKEPLTMNRMSEATLHAMWDAVAGARPTLVAYMQRKAKLLGQERLHWYDEDAPLGKTLRKVDYDESAEFIVEQFGRFSPRMADFAGHAFENAWIESEDRSGKMPGGFCTGFPLTGESRIFLTFGGDPEGVNTIAHELGHGYHTHVMKDLPPMARQYAMNVAETASTFAELITRKAAIAKAQSTDERLALLDQSVSGGVNYLMNIHARFLFETRFYDARRRGMLTVDQLNDLMVAAQKEAFGDALATYHPYFWASKGHFYATEAPFYNFPYTFGYLFSAGIYAQAQAEGPAFEQRYVDLLRDTGRMTVEDLAMRHLGADLTKPDFWQRAVTTVTADADQFLELTK